jgi:signal transduction histidine kinase/ligand-binding sensor domain-containing protein
MKKSNKNFYSFLLVMLASACFVPVELLGQSENVIFRNITPAEGLPVTSVNDVTQDAFGYIWMGTWEGTYRYDGSTFERMSASGRYVEADHKGGVWISYDREGTVAYYSTATDSLHFYQIPDFGGRFPKIVADAAGYIWIATTRGLYRFNEATDAIEKVSPLEKSPVNDIVAHADSSISILYSTSDEFRGIASRFTDGTFEFKEIPVNQNRTQEQGIVPENKFTLLPFQETGVVLVHNLGWAYKEHRAAEWVLVDHGETEVLLEPLRITTTHKNNLYVVHRNGLTKFDIRSGDYSTFSHNALNIQSLLQFDQVGADFRLLIDRQEVLWIPSFAQGYTRLNLYESDFGLLRSEDGTPILDVLTAVEMEDGSFWVGTRFQENSLYHFDSDRNIIERLSGLSDSSPGKTVNNVLNHPFVWSLAQGSDGSIWAGTGSVVAGTGGLNRIRTGSNRITRFRHDPDNEASLYPANMVRSIIEDGSGRIWVSDRYSIAWIDPDTEVITRFEHPEDFGISGDEAVFILKTDTGDLIMSTQSNTYYRIHHADLSTELIGRNLELRSSSRAVAQQQMDLKGTEVDFVYRATRIAAQDSKNRFWVMDNSGFGLLDSSLTVAKKWFDIETYNFPFARLGPMRIDGNNMIWLGTDKGIIKFDPDKETHTHYSYERGLQGHSFLTWDNHQGPSGKIYFYGTGGINIFDPNRIRVNPHPPDMVFTNLTLDGRPVSIGPDQPITSPVQLADRIVVQPDISIIGFEFAAMHFAGDRSNRYQYRLEGFDTDWRDGGLIGQATYTNLSPGNYTFRIRGSNLDGIWSDGSTSISVVVLPPWYRTWWAYGFYLMMLVMAIVAADRVQRRRVQQKEREKAREKELEQAKEIEKAYKNLEEAHSKLETAHQNLKSAQDQLVQQEKLASLGQLTAGIAHEIKNPLNFVNNFSDVSTEMINELIDAMKNGDLIEAEALAGDISQNLKKIHEHGSRADGIVKSMLQHSRGGDGKMEPTDLNALVKEYVNLSYHGMRAGKDPIEIDIELNLDESIGEVPLIAEDFSRVILNLCNNAFDACSERSRSACTERKSGSFERLPQGGSPRSVSPNNLHEPPWKPRLTIRTAKTSGAIKIEIEDNGPGIPDEIKDKILQPFFTTKKGTQGTGLGLSITHDIVKAHGGILSIEKNKAGGATFVIILHTHQTNRSKKA